MIIGNIKIEKFLYEDKTLNYVSYIDLSEPEFEYREYSNGTKAWFKNGKYHRENGLPAFVDSDGSREWYKDGKLHRDDDLPAVLCSDGTKEWYKNGERHREGDAAAIIRANGTKAWYKNGNKIYSSI